MSDIPITWDRSRFESTRAQYQRARKLIESSINSNMKKNYVCVQIIFPLVQFEKRLKDLYLQNRDIEKHMSEINENLLKCKTRANIFGNLTEIATQSLSNFC